MRDKITINITDPCGNLHSTFTIAWSTYISRKGEALIKAHLKAAPENSKWDVPFEKNNKRGFWNYCGK